MSDLSLISNQKPFTVFSLTCPVEEVNDRTALVGTSCLASVDWPHLHSQPRLVLSVCVNNQFFRLWYGITQASDKKISSKFKSQYFEYINCFLFQINFLHVRCHLKPFVNFVNLTFKYEYGGCSRCRKVVVEDLSLFFRVFCLWNIGFQSSDVLPSQKAYAKVWKYSHHCSYSSGKHNPEQQSPNSDIIKNRKIVRERKIFRLTFFLMICAEGNTRINRYKHG